ncbi:MAG: competence protein CoiA family protein, partial [Microcoleus sp.]
MLTAMNEDLVYFNPSLYSQAERDRNIPLIRELANEGKMLCPHCLSSAGERHEVSLVNPKQKIIHFRHKKGDRTQECSSYRGESDQHLTAKLALLAELSSNSSYAHVELRTYGEGVNSGKFRKPDVTSFNENEEKHAHEIQVSPITIDALKERTDALRSLGFTQVHWYLSERNRKDEIVNFLIDHMSASPYQLLFSDDGLPSWRLMLQKIIKMAKQPSPSSATLFRVDCEGVRWTYHKQFQTIAIYLGQHRDKHSIRLPGDRNREVLQSEIADPFCQQAGGP